MLAEGSGSNPIWRIPWSSLFHICCSKCHILPSVLWKEKSYQINWEIFVLPEVMNEMVQLCLGHRWRFLGDSRGKDGTNSILEQFQVRMHCSHASEESNRHKEMKVNLVIMNKSSRICRASENFSHLWTKSCLYPRSALDLQLQASSTKTATRKWTDPLLITVT